MPINEFGEFVRTRNAPEKTPSEQLRSAYEAATRAQSRMPSGFTREQPQGVLYYSPLNLNQIQQQRDIIASLATDNNLVEFLGFDQKPIVIADALEEIDRNLEFSQSVHKELGL